MAVLMAEDKRNKGGRPKGDRPPKEMITAFRGSAAFAKWFIGLVDHCKEVTGWRGISKTDVIVKALISFAKEVGYEPKAPNGD